MLVALFRKTPQPKPCTILKFVRDDTVKFVRNDASAKFKWADKPTQKEVTIPENERDRLYNAFLISGNDILTVYEKRCILMDFNLKQLKDVAVNTANLYWTGITSFSGQCFDPDDEGYWMSQDISLGKKNAYTGTHPVDLPNFYKGDATGGYNAWLMKVKLNKDELQLICDDYNTDSMVLKGEYCWSTYEFAPNKLITYSDEAGHLLFVIHYFKVIRTIVEASPGNG